MEICHICSYFENTLFSDLVEELGEVGIPGRVYYFLPKGQPAINADHDYADVRYCYNKNDRFIFHLKHLKVWKDYKQYLENHSFSMNYAHSLFSNGYIAYRAKKEYGIPYVVYVQNTDVNVFFRYRRFLHGLGCNILKNADAIIFSSQSYLTLLLDKYIHNETLQKDIRSKSFVIPYGINDWFFEHQEEENEYIPNPKTIKVLTVGLICHNKNQISVAKALEKVRQQGYEIEYSVIGKFGSDHVVEQLRAYDFVNIFNYMPKEDLIRYYRENDLFCLPSRTETFGLVYAEALSQGLPIIYTKGQGFDQQFPDGKVGFSVLANSEDDIAQHIISLKQQTDMNLKNACVEAAYKFKWENIMHEYQKMFETLNLQVGK